MHVGRLRQDPGGVEGHELIDAGQQVSRGTTPRRAEVDELVATGGHRPHGRPGEQHVAHVVQPRHQDPAHDETSIGSPRSGPLAFTMS